MTIETTFTPAGFETLRQRDLSDTACVVFDVLRATSTIVTALARGAESILPVATIEEALRYRADDPQVLLAGERNGLRISAAVSGAVDFDLGNSPREYTSTVVRNRRIVTTTTNGTRAFAACRGARFVLAGSFLNLNRTAQHILRLNCEKLILVCSGTGEDQAFEDNLAAGALCRRLIEMDMTVQLADSARFTVEQFDASREDLEAAMCNSSNARRLMSIPELRDDVPFCLTQNLYPIVVFADARGWLHRADLNQ